MNLKTVPLRWSQWRMLIAPVVLLVGLALWGVCSPSSTSGAGNSSLQGEAALRHLKDQGSYDSLREAVTTARYSVHQDRDKSNVWRGVNEAHGLKEDFTSEGAQVEVKAAAGRSHRVGLKLRGVGYGKREVAIGPGNIEGKKNRIEITRSMERGQLTEWYVNTAAGLEHGFTLSVAPGERRDERLRIAMTLEGDLRARVGGARQAIELENARGESVLRYEKLEVVDARGRKLEAAMGAGVGELWLEVDDRDAVYPVTIDPTLTQQAYLKASNTGVGDRLGYSVAVSGDTVVVGAPFESSNATGVNGNQGDNSAVGSGSAYVFVRSAGAWSQQAYLKASNTDVGFFGVSVAVSGDTVVVGAPQENSGATGVNGNQSDNSAHHSGAAYVFVRSAGVWSQQAYLKASNTGVGDRLGYSVAVSGDTVVVGAPSEESNTTGVNGNENDNWGIANGAAYVFVRTGTMWSQQAYLKASNTGDFDYFGQSVAVSGDTVIVGAYYEGSSATGVNGNGGDNSAYLSGAAYVFVRTGTMWSQQAYLKASNTSAFDLFGNSVAVSGDTVVVGAQQEFSSATGVNGNQGDNSAPLSGAAYVFVRTGTMWSQQAYLKASNTEGADQFGWSVAVSGDTVVVGAPFEDSNATGVNGAENNNSADASGAAYVFLRSAGVWSQQAYLKASNTGANDQFGWPVAVSGDTVVVGAHYEDSSATGVNGDESDNAASDSGAAYVFSPNSAPMIATVPVTRTQGTPVSNSTIANVNDAQDAEETLNVTVNGGASATVNGVTVSNISISAAGVVTADVEAVCGATSGDFALRVSDSGSLFTETTLNVTVTVETTLPVINLPADIVTTLPLNSPATSTIVNYAVTASDNCGTPTVIANPASGSTFPIGTTTVNVTATDAAGNTATGSFTVTVLYDFTGFFQPVDNLPTVNVAIAGSSIPVKFSLSGNKGLNILAAGYPVSQVIACSTGAPSDAVEETVTAGSSSLSFDATIDQYKYVWKTDKAWKGTCRQLIVKLNDGTLQVANFQFK